MTAKTVKVRIAVAVDPEGKWQAHGWQPRPDHVQRDAKFMQDTAREDLEYGEAMYWIEAELPVPEAQTVQGTVTPADVGGAS